MHMYLDGAEVCIAVHFAPRASRPADAADAS
jgi:hypothetical protein